MSVPVINVIRANVVETIHRGDLVVVDGNGEIIYSLGDPEKITYFRSAAKPIQAINVVTSGAYTDFGLNEKELAVICSSHYAEDFHIEAVQSILNKIDLKKENILGGIVHSLKNEIALKQAVSGIKIDERFSDCSGKQSGMLAVCRKRDYSLNDYLDPHHQCQQEILSDIGKFCEIDKRDFSIGIDGCSAPVHALPLKNMAIGFRNLSNPNKLSNENKQAADLIFRSMNRFPEMISGTDGFCTELIKHSNGKLVGKVGAEGVYCVGIKDSNIGIALKIESGSMAVIPPVILKVLIKLNILDESEIEALKRYVEMENLNDKGTVVGKIQAVF
jgi:L-asparaginase II